MKPFTFMEPVTPPSKPARFDPWPVSIVAFFSLAILGCGTFIAFCSRHPADLISPNYYGDVWTSPYVRQVLTGAILWMLVGDYIMYRMVRINV